MALNQDVVERLVDAMAQLVDAHAPTPVVGCRAAPLPVDHHALVGEDTVAQHLQTDQRGHPNFWRIRYRVPISFRQQQIAQRKRDQ